MAFDYEIKCKEGSSIPHARDMSRLNFDQDEDESNLVDYLSPNHDYICGNFAKQKLIPIEELRREYCSDELANRIIKGVIDGDWIHRH